jgi:hypothetical protein
MIRRVLLVAALLVGTTAAVAVPVGTASARPVCMADYQCTTTFYADAQHTVFNGQTVRLCNGTSESVGVLEGYSVTFQGPCSSDN